MDYPEFSEGVALVIGGSGGIGAAISTTLAKAGSNVALTYFSRIGNAQDVATEITAMGRQCHIAQADITDPVAVQRVVDDVVARFGKIHSLVYAAGPSMEFLYIHEISQQEWARVFNADVNGCFNVIAAALPHLKKQGSGSVVALVTGAVDRPPPRDILSAAPKAAIQALIKGLAREEGRYGIRANCVGPGYIEAGLGLSTVHEHTRDFVDKMVRAIPLKRAGQAQDIADVVCFMLSDKSRYVTGESVAVAGGLQLV